MTPTPGTASAQLADKISQLYHCADCNYCVDAVWQERQWDHVCPTLAHHSPSLSYSGRGYMNLARAIHEGAEFPLEDIADRVFTCTGCGNCETVCPIGLSPRDVNVALREMMVSNDAAPAPLIEEKNRLMVGSDRLTQADISLDMVDILYLVGCEAAPNEQSGFDILKSITPNAALLGTAGKCCGSNLAALGFAAEATQAAQEVADDINIYPHLSAIVLANPKCRKSLPADPRLSTFPAWLCEKLNNSDLQVTPKSVAPTVSYVDTCSDSLWNADVRRLLECLAQRGKLKITNQDSPSPLAMCCGAGGGLPVMANESAARMAKAKYSKARDEIADETALIVGDPGCLAHIKLANKQTEDLFGLVEFLTKYFEFSSGNAS